MTDERDDELNRRIAATLERSLDAIEPDALAHLAQARRHARDRRRRVRQVVGGFALAAGVAAVAITPWLSRPTVDTAAAPDMSYLSVDPQLLADMDMLEVLGTEEMSADVRVDSNGV